MLKQKGPSKTSKIYPKDDLGDDLKEMPDIPEHEVVEALIDRIRDISPKNDKAK